MEATQLVHALERQGEALAHAFLALPDDESRWRPAANKWSALEILGHLVDEERSDFRVRLRLTLEDPARPWPAIDPEGRVREQAHNQGTLAELVEGLRRERRTSLEWLRSLSEPAWERAHAHPTLGPLRAGDLLAAWAAHDVLHLRQLANTRFAWIREASAPYSTRYSDA